MSASCVLLLEPFYCGSHKQLIDLLHTELTDSELFSLPGKKWHWRARTSSLYFSQEIPREHSFRVLFASSVLNLAELVALRPDLGCLRKVLYFHENQLVYPVRKQQDRDFQYGYNQILSCLVADKVLFNSKYNMESFLSSINTFLKLIPDHRPKGIPELIRPKCSVLNFPITYPHKPLDLGNKHLDTEEENLSESPGDEVTKKATTDRVGCILAADISAKQDFSVAFSAASADKTSAENEGLGLELSEVKAEKRLKTNTDDSNDSLTSRNRKTENTKSLALTKEHCEEKSPSIYSELANDVNNTVGIADVSDLNEAIAMSAEEDINSDIVKPNNEMSFTHSDKPLHIVWPHRWEHDKGPETFFKILFQLADLGLCFHLSVLGEQFSDVPEIFTEARERLGEKILHWGYQSRKEEYFDILNQADCVVSTALHEFFGVAMLEAVYCGCYPLCPNRLVYPEIFPAEYLYNTDNQLLKKLCQFCKKPSLCRNHQLKVDVQQYSWDNLKSSYTSLLYSERNCDSNKEN